MAPAWRSYWPTATVVSSARAPRSACGARTSPRFLRIVIVRTRPGHGAEWEAEERAVKQASERQTPGSLLTVSQSSVGQTLGTYYLTSFGASIAALASPKTLPALLAHRAYRDFTKM